MKPCDEYSSSVLLYRDGELSGHELEAFLSHLQHCPDCARMLEEERSLSELLHRARPLYAAPDSLRARVAETLQPNTGFYPRAPNRLRRHIRNVLREPSVESWWTGQRWQVAAVVILLVGLGVFSIPSLLRQARAKSFVNAAVITHRDYMEGHLPLEIRSDSPAAVTAWFTGKVPFRFQLPNSDTARYGKADYRMTGGRLVAFRGGYAALVSYEMQDEKISLLVTSSKYAIASGGSQTQAAGLTFHYRNHGGFRVITWSNHNLTYALVSTMRGSSRQSCLVCHQNMTDRNVFVNQP